MPEPSTSIEDRIRALESQVLRLTGLAGLLVLGWLVTAILQAVPRPRVEARAFVLRDSLGRVRGSLSTRHDASPVLRLDDTLGRPRVYAVVHPDGSPHVSMLDSTWASRARIELEASGVPRVWVETAQPRAYAQLTVGRDGQPIAELVREARSLRLSLADSARAAR